MSVKIKVGDIVEFCPSTIGPAGGSYSRDKALGTIVAINNNHLMEPRFRVKISEADSRRLLRNKSYYQFHVESDGTVIWGDPGGGWHASHFTLADQAVPMDNL